MLGNAVLKIEHDTQAIYYLCVLNLGYRIVCPTTSFGRCALDTSVHFSLHVDCSGKQTDKPQVRTMERRWCMCVRAQKRMVRVAPNDPKTLSDVTQSRKIFRIYLRWNTAVLSCLMSEELNLSWCYLSHRNFRHGTVSVGQFADVNPSWGWKKKQQLSNKSLKQPFFSPKLSWMNARPVITSNVLSR